MKLHKSLLLVVFKYFACWFRQIVRVCYHFIDTKFPIHLVPFYKSTRRNIPVGQLGTKSKRRFIVQRWICYKYTCFRLFGTICPTCWYQRHTSRVLRRQMSDIGTRVLCSYVRHSFTLIPMVLVNDMSLCRLMTIPVVEATRQLVYQMSYSLPTIQDYFVIRLFTSSEMKLT